MIAGLFFLTSSTISALSFAETKADKMMSRRGLRYLALAMVISVVGPTAVLAVVG